jgi:hypothetical protein
MGSGQSTSSNPITNTSSNPITNTSSKPIMNTSSNPITNTSSNPIMNTSSNPITNTSNNQITNTYGDIHFISFLSAVLSRLAYMNDNKFLTSYNSIMGQVIQPEILQSINKVNSDSLSDLLDDQKIFGLNKGENDIFKDYEYQYKGKNYIDFIALNMPQNVNIINGDLPGTASYPIPGQEPSPDTVKYISIGWSNYGEIYVVADKRMPNTIFLIFRGTYSAKTAALYTKPTSLTPLAICDDTTINGDKFLYGIFKSTAEMIHTIIESMSYLATNFLSASEPNSVKIFTTGHSLGGAMCSDFAYLWMGIKKIAPYNSAPYNVLADNIVCISLGAPRCMSKLVAKKFCDFVSQKKILFLRITTRGDPVPGMPQYGYSHPCSDDSEMRMEISEDCNPVLTMRPTPNVNYKKNLDCANIKKGTNIPNPLSHTIYLDILYTKAVDILNFLKGIGTAKEVLRTQNNSTVCRLITGQMSDGYKTIFFDVNKAREMPTSDIDIEKNGLSNVVVPTDNISEENSVSVKTGGGFGFSMPKVGGSVAEDRRMTKDAFNSLINQMVTLTGNLCPQSGTIANPFNNQIMPDLSCPSNKIGGRRTRRYNKNKNKKSKKHRTK